MPSECLNAAYLKVQLLHRGSGTGSDHVFYEQKRVPVIDYTAGIHGDMHHASDTMEKIDLDKLEKVAGTAYAASRALANAASRPRDGCLRELRHE